MPTDRLSHIFFLVLFSLFLVRCGSHSHNILTNKSKELKAELGTDGEGNVFYRIFNQERVVLDTSYLGLESNQGDFHDKLNIKSISSAVDVYDEYTLTHGKQIENKYEAQEYVIEVVNENGNILLIRFSLSEHGVAYRYELSADNTITISQEYSSFHFSENAKAWLQPMSKAKSGWEATNPSYEEHYYAGVPVSKPSVIGEGYVYPILVQSGDDWVHVSETNLHRNYCGTRLQYDEDISQLRVTFPQKEEVFPGGGVEPQAERDLVSPWRIMTIGSLKNIVESNLGTDLAAKSKINNTDFVKPGLASWSWILLKDDFIEYPTSKRFIDYASEMGWPYCLIDVDWDQKIGYDRMKELVAYAKSKNVGVILWYNSSGDWNTTPYTPKSKLVDGKSRRAEFQRLKEMGVAGCKIDFFGGDGQSVIAYYHDILSDAADYQLLINFHGCTLPRGWHRTYPHLMTMESIKGQEFITFEQANADKQPEHCM